MILKIKSNNWLENDFENQNQIISKTMILKIKIKIIFLSFIHFFIWYLDLDIDKIVFLNSFLIIMLT